MTNNPVWAWRKSSFSEPNGECVELGWRKSTSSQPTGDCVELAPALSAVRDSKNPTGPTMAVAGLRTFLREIKEGRFDL